MNTNNPNDPNQLPDDSVFADRLRGAFQAEEATIESRRREGVTAQRPAGAPPLWSRPIFALSALALLLIGGFTAFNLLDGNNDTTETIEVASPPSPTPTPGPIETPGPTPGTTTEPTPRVTVGATVSATPPSPTPGSEDPTPGTVPAEPSPTPRPPTAYADISCASLNPTADILRVTDVAVDDPDGGLVVHTAAGVNTPVIGVLPHHATARATGPCEITADGATWREVDNGIGLAGWVNTRFLSPDQNFPPGFGLTAAPLSIHFPKNPESLDNFGFTTAVTRWAVTDNMALAMLQALEAGPTGAEAEAGIITGFDQPFMCSSDITAGEPVERYQESVAVTICPAGSAGVGQDAIRQSMMVNTFIQLPDITHVAVINGLANQCLGSQSGEPGLPCLERTTANASCTAGVAFADAEPVPVVTPDAAPSAMNHVRDIWIGQGGTDDNGCTVVTLEMGEGWSGQGTSMTTSVVGNGVAVSRRGSNVILHMPEGFTSETPREFNYALWNDPGHDDTNGVVLLMREPAPSTTGFVLIANGSSGPVYVNTLANPARIVVAMPNADPSEPSPAPGVLDSTAAGASTFEFYLEAVIPTDDGVFVSGYGRAFEATANVAVQSLDGSESFEFTLGGESALPDSTAFLTGGFSGWREFSISIGGLEAGEYRATLNSCDQCDPDIGVELPSFTFTVG